MEASLEQQIKHQYDRALTFAKVAGKIRHMASTIRVRGTADRMRGASSGDVVSPVMPQPRQYDVKLSTSVATPLVHIEIAEEVQRELACAMERVAMLYEVKAQKTVAEVREVEGQEDKAA